MTHYCPITCDPIESDALYSIKGLRQLSPKLTTLNSLPYSAQEQRDEAIARAAKLSIQGVQPKLSAILDVRQQSFTFVDKQGSYILKPESNLWAELPANEAISMTLAKHFNIDVPLHGLVFAKNNELTYFIKRYDRLGKHKIAVEDFAQLSNNHRETKYNSTIEKVIKVINECVTFPTIEYIKLFRRVLFNFVIGNEDMHLKNYSIINKDGIKQLAPAYDFINTTIAMRYLAEESALPINGRKNKLTKEDFIDYLASERLKLTITIIKDIMAELEGLQETFIDLIGRSYLSDDMKEAYVSLLNERYGRLF